MHITPIASLVLILSLTTPAQSAHRSTSTRHGSRSRRLLHDIGVALNSLLPDGMKSRSLPTRNLSRRGAVMNANGQCMLKANTGLTPSTDGQSPATTRTGTSAATSTSTRKGSATGTASPSSTWVTKFEAAGKNFFDPWYFREGADFTHGTVTYQGRSSCEANNLIEIDSDGNAVMRVETTPQVSNTRMSVRIESLQQFNGGLWILDATHMPAGCATWPAFWTVGPGWPNKGEIDIVEGVNGNTFNQVSLHAKDGCSLTPNAGFTGSMVGDTGCSSSGDNRGCGIMDKDPNSFGATFNAIGGGVHAMLWDDSGISVWFFPRKSIPSDITNNAPNPSSWGSPAAKYLASSCNPWEFFQDHTTIFDTTLCGDWSGGAWNAAPNSGAQSCAQSTGYSSCDAYVRANGGDFSEAYWIVKSVRIYQHK